MPPSIPACHPVLQLITIRKIILRVHSLFKSRACYTIIALFMATFPSRPRFLPISTFSLTRPNQITEKPIQPFAKGAYTITERRKKEEEEEQGHECRPWVCIRSWSAHATRRRRYPKCKTKLPSHYYRGEMGWQDSQPIVLEPYHLSFYKKFDIKRNRYHLGPTRGLPSMHLSFVDFDCYVFYNFFSFYF